MLLNPLSGIDRPKRVLAWGLFDTANQSFTLLIITLLFPLFVQNILTAQPVTTPEQTQALATALEAGTPLTPELQLLNEQLEDAQAQGKLNWSLMHGGSLLLVVLLSPFVGALSDARGYRKQFLIGTGILCGALTCFLGVFTPGQVVLAGLLYATANVCYQIGENFLASFLPQLSTPRTVGRVSAFGWTLGYVGALVLLVLTLAQVEVFGLALPDESAQLFVFAGAWFLVGILPATIYLKDESPPPTATDSGVFTTAFSRVKDTLAHASAHRQLGRFLLAFMVYGFGVQIIIGFAGIIASDFGITGDSLIIYVAQITVVAGIAAAITSTFQDRIGGRATVLAYLVIWIVSTAALLAARLIWPSGGPQWPIWLIGNGLGCALGGIGTASRALVARFTPKHRTAEFFGLWGMVYKFAGAIGVLSFGAVAKLFGDVASLGLLLGFFCIGAILVTRVDEIAGVRAARRAEREALR